MPDPSQTTNNGKLLPGMDPSGRRRIYSPVDVTIKKVSDWIVTLVLPDKTEREVSWTVDGWFDPDQIWCSPRSPHREIGMKGTLLIHMKLLEPYNGPHRGPKWPLSAPL